MDYIFNFFVSDFGYALLRFALCMLVNWVIIDRLYYKKSRRRDFYFTFMLMSVAIFFLVFFMMGMDRGKATMGVGLGLFGIFSIMRYRTDTMPVREMTYLFIIICLSVVHAMFDAESEWGITILLDLLKLAIIDAIAMSFIVMCERSLKILNTKLIQYDRPELCKPENKEKLIADLEERTGLKIRKVEVGGFDFLKDTVVLRVTYDGSGKANEVDGQFKVRKSQWRNV